MERIGRKQVLAGACERQAREGVMRRVGLLHAQIGRSDRPDAVQPRYIERLLIGCERRAPYSVRAASADATWPACGSKRPDCTTWSL